MISPAGTAMAAAMTAGAMTQQTTIVMVCRGCHPDCFEHTQVMHPFLGGHQRGVEHAQPGQHPHEQGEPREQGRVQEPAERRGALGADEDVGSQSPSQYLLQGAGVGLRAGARCEAHVVLMDGQPRCWPPRVCELTHMAATGLGMNTSPAIRTVTGLPLTVSVTLSPVARWVSEANAVLTTTWPGPLYQRPLTRLQPSHDESPPYA